MLADIWRAIRAYWRTSQFTLTAVVTMGLGIGANTAVFSFVSALLLRPMPHSDPERLVTIASVRGGERGKLMPREWEELNQDSLTFDGVAAWYPSQYNLTEGGAPEVVRACMTTANLFRVLGVGFAQGTSWQRVRTDGGRSFASSAWGPLRRPRTPGLGLEFTVGAAT